MPKKLSDEELKLMVESGYSKKAIDLYVNSVNVGPLENPSVVTTFRGRCGDLIKLYLKIDKKDKIENASFYYLGCPGSATSASAMTTLLKGMTVTQAKNMTENDILNELGGLPKSKTDCATLSIKTLRKAIAEYEKQKGRSEI
ncbi:MAG: iron-sulfur cluster assembly scaffold protein [Candidatus Bathyarchaeia archaeon]